uniref:Uncharacterized protein n=1 Tax=Attheya septentrionalis TaxID=420275 RepID=A0A7S2U6C5_9STRA|mmetsp:Transcript_12370/g.22456  ORF Transcript_12370/g.22456 Transcript_12370/m.22456 type:complete len:269 (+) Transcript_12370:178-984(+)|eukprot:CAMPEP_0198298214 /NCGR_PEP_ID=MMETSP1449-20131203/40097_1 /TAXON_ID=420275 /ORGANISM="Attheya septentrionalis, Strain CCMP2084" /LENGTH=268 /DNA_ID=CAMNT_0043999423 /DNA_START=66 /DNA_END=872 /DNA_ORIENTATION=-
MAESNGDNVDQARLVLLLILAPLGISALWMLIWNVYYFGMKWNRFWRRYKKEGDVTTGRVVRRWKDEPECFQDDETGPVAANNSKSKSNSKSNIRNDGSKRHHVAIEYLTEDNTDWVTDAPVIQRIFNVAMTTGQMGIQGKPGIGTVTKESYHATGEFLVLVLPGLPHSGFPQMEVDNNVQTTTTMQLVSRQPWYFHVCSLILVVLLLYPCGIGIFFLDTRQQKVIAGIVTLCLYAILIPITCLVVRRQFRCFMDQSIHTLDFTNITD